MPPGLRGRVSSRTTKNWGTLKSAIRAWALEQIADFKVPQFIVVRDDPLPRNPGGKVLKPSLRESVVWGEQLR